MTRYASVQDMTFAIGADTLRLIADHDGDSVADVQVVERALDEASALAATYVPQDLLPHLVGPSTPPTDAPTDAEVLAQLDGLTGDALTAKLLELSRARQPVSSVPIALRNAVISIAAHIMRRSRDQLTDDSRAAYADALAWLKMLAAGVVKLDVVIPPGLEDSGIMVGDPEAEGQPRVWNRRSAAQVF